MLCHVSGFVLCGVICTLLNVYLYLLYVYEMIWLLPNLLESIPITSLVNVDDDSEGVRFHPCMNTLYVYLYGMKTYTVCVFYPTTNTHVCF